MEKLKLGIPSKGRLMESTLDWFASRGIQISMSRESREYAAKIVEMPKIQVILMSASEIPKALLEGEIELGVTGQDLVREMIPVWNESVSELRLLGFGKADLVLAVPKFWVDVDSIDDFDDVAINFRAKNGFRLRIATKYHNLISSHLRRMGVADYQLTDSKGATEGTIKNNAADAIADITSSGQTLKANHLKIVGDIPILRSQATLFKSHMVNWTPNKVKILDDLKLKI